MRSSAFGGPGAAQYSSTLSSAAPNASEQALPQPGPAVFFGCELVPISHCSCARPCASVSAFTNGPAALPFNAARSRGPSLTITSKRSAPGGPPAVTLQRLRGSVRVSPASMRLAPSSAFGNSR